MTPPGGEDHLNKSEDHVLSYNISFISLGCAKNQVNCEQMMAAVQAAGQHHPARPPGGRCGGGEHLRLSGLRLRGGH